MTKFCFVSYEIHPTVKGGCGVLLHHSARMLLSQGHEVVFLLDVAPDAFERFNKQDRLALPNPQNCRAYLVSRLLQGTDLPLDIFTTFFELKAYHFYLTLRKVYLLEKPDLVEFFEYCGVAYHALNAKLGGLDFQEARLVVRLHSSLEMIDRYQPGNRHGLDRYIMYNLERHAMRFAESVLYPSHAYLQKIYTANYEPWFGEAALSQPAMLDHPVFPGPKDDADGVLFFGRLFGLKGTDSFTDAAVLYLSNPENPRRNFYYAGYDSYLPPTGTGSYQDYLLRKIPAHYRKYFHFLGQLSWEKLSELLPRMLFGVIPSYLESYCYAAHELYEAGLPLIVSNIPAFEDLFHDGVNALVFDGTVGDLAEKMSLLSGDAALRRRITCPYSLDRQPLGDYPALLMRQSWISDQTPKNLPGLLVCVLADQPELLNQTLKSIPPEAERSVQVVLFYPSDQAPHVDDPGAGASVWFLGGLYTPFLPNGAPINPTDIRTSETLLILRAGDVLAEDFLDRLGGVLARQPQIAFAGGWKHRKRKNKLVLETLPLDAALEITPIIQASPFSRCVMRTNPDTLLIDLFDMRLGRLGELAYLWQLNTDRTAGVILPTPLLTVCDPPEPMLDQPTFDYLVLRDVSPWRKMRLARFPLTLANRQKTLRRFYFQDQITTFYQQQLHRLIGALATSRLSRMADKLPWLKNGIRSVVSSFLRLVSGGRQKELD